MSPEWKENRKERIAHLCLLASLATTAAGGFYSYRLFAHQREWTASVVERLTAIRDASNRYAEMESELRAYEFTHSPSYLEGYRTRQARESIARLQQLAGNRDERQVADGLAGALQQRISIAEFAATRLRPAAPREQEVIALVDSGERISIRFRQLLVASDRGESQLIAAEMAAERWSALALGAIVMFLSAAAAGGVAISLKESVTQRHQRERADHDRNNALIRERDALKRELAAEERVVETFDTIADGLFVFDPEFRYLYVNPQGERITGKSKRELIGKCIWDALPQKLGAEFERVYRSVMANRTPATCEGFHPTWTRWLEVRAFPNRFPGGITVFLRDVSELKNAREEQARLLREVYSANDLLRGIMEGSSDLIAAIDAGYHYIASNQSYRSAIQAMTGREIGPSMTVTGLRFHDAAQARTALAAWKMALEGGESTTTEEFVLLGGIRRTFEVHYFSIRDPAGKIVGASAIARDFTERRMAEQALLSAHDALNAQMRRRTEELQEKEVLLQEVHHRVKNNLQVVSSLLSMQRNLVADEAARDAFQQSENRILSMAMIHEFLYQNSDFSSLDLVAYLRRVAGHLASSYGKDAVECRVSGAPIVLNLEKAIPCGLIVNELVSNSFKHAFPNGAAGAIDVDVRRDNGSVSVTVSDNGAGLPSDFELPSNRSLGLQVVNTLATRQLHGKIQYASQGGSRFSFVFEEKSG